MVGAERPGAGIGDLAGRFLGFLDQVLQSLPGGARLHDDERAGLHHGANRCEGFPGVAHVFVGQGDDDDGGMGRADEQVSVRLAGGHETGPHRTRGPGLVNHGDRLAQVFGHLFHVRPEEVVRVPGLEGDDDLDGFAGKLLLRRRSPSRHRQRNHAVAANTRMPLPFISTSLTVIAKSFLQNALYFSTQPESITPALAPPPSRGRNFLLLPIFSLSPRGRG